MFPSFSTEPCPEDPSIKPYEIVDNLKVNDLYPDLSICLPPDAECSEDVESSWQGYPDIEVSGDIIYIAWSDRRNLGAWNSDIYLARIGPDPDEPCYYRVVDNVPVNDNVKLYDYLRADRYIQYGPASATQYRPSIAASPDQPWPFVVWDDNRRSDPLQGYVGNCDIFFAPPGQTKGCYFSPIIDAESEKATWYMLDWWGVTPYGTNLTLQTRMGNTPWPDENWSQWTGPVTQTSPMEQNEEWVYDAPGQHIVDEDRNPFPQSRYIQYRVNLINCPTCAPWASPCLSRVTLYYRRVYTIFLPLTLKSYTP